MDSKDNNSFSFVSLGNLLGTKFFQNNYIVSLAKYNLNQIHSSSYIGLYICQIKGRYLDDLNSKVILNF